MATFIIWAVVLVIFGGGVFLCGTNLIKGTGGDKFRSIIAIILGIITFSCVYRWFESIGWCLFFSGLVVGLVSLGGKGEPAKTNKTGGVIDALGEIGSEILEKKALEETIENAIRKSKE